MNTDKERGGRAPHILNVGNCDITISEKMEEIQKEVSWRALYTAKMRARRHSFKSQKIQQTNLHMGSSQ